MIQARGFDAVLFDLDGVLVDTEPWWDGARLAFAAAHGRDWGPADQHAVRGANSSQWAAIMRERLGLTNLREDAIQDAIVDGVLAQYRAGRLAAIASSSHPAILRAAVRALGLEDVLGAAVSSDEVASGKPSPDVYLLAASRLGVPPRRCLVVEDSVNGVRAGKAGG